MKECKIVNRMKVSCRDIVSLVYVFTFTSIFITVFVVSIVYNDTNTIIVAGIFSVIGLMSFIVGCSNVCSKWFTREVEEYEAYANV
jgi:uncharacterized protein YqhQ